METSHNESLTLVAAVIGAAALGSQSHTLGLGGAAVGDIAILLALFAFDGIASRSGGQSLAFGSAAGFCLLTPFQVLANALSPAPANDRPYWLMPAVWLTGTLLLFAVDRFRMSSRDSVSLTDAGLTGMSGMQPFTMGQSPTFRPAPIRVAPVEPVQTAFTAAARPEAPTAAVETAPVIAPPPVPAPVAPPPDVTAIPPGREALIYLNLVGEGLNVLRTVRAENLGRDYYRIADVMPEGEQWEFTPGQVVRCRKKSLSNGKQMVAYEEAPRAQ